MVAATSRDQSTAWQWPSGLFALASDPTSGRYGEQLAVCTPHRGQHVFHDGACSQLPPHATTRLYRPRSVVDESPAVVQLDEDRLGTVVEERVFSALRRAQAARQAERRR